MIKSKQVVTAVLEYALVIIVAVLLSTLIRSYLFCGTHVVGESMYPTLHNNDLVVMNKIPKYTHQVNKGDIVSIVGVEQDKTYVKRVIGLPGDTVEIIDNKIILNGKPVYEDYLDSGVETQSYGVSSWDIPEGKLFVLGDNRYNSMDSRSFGLIDYDQITGVGVARYFPLDRMGKLK